MKTRNSERHPAGSSGRKNVSSMADVRKTPSGEERFRLLVEAVRDYAIFMLDPEGRILTWNAGAERIKGYRAEEIIGQNYSLFFLPEDIASGRPDEILRIA